jgi:hypothetical protein
LVSILLKNDENLPKQKPIKFAILFLVNEMPQFYLKYIFLHGYYLDLGLKIFADFLEEICKN